MNVEQLAEERMASTLAIKDSNKRDAKRERDDYAVNLRKQKREELQKRRRGITTTTAAPTLGQGMMNPTGKIEGQEEYLKHFENIQMALEFMRTNQLKQEEFFNLVGNKMKFEKSQFG
mmetsp:Transcript_15387/g.23690  ORF Transcript_15387/g.23690 Transcript_15387/m.23690 type:complete len:118 (+) Transcript_15387:87-440(+)